MRNKADKIRVIILKAITVAATIGFFVAGSAVDSESNVPIIICIICMAWLGLMTAANMEGK